MNPTWSGGRVFRCGFKTTVRYFCFGHLKLLLYSVAICKLVIHTIYLFKNVGYFIFSLNTLICDPFLFNGMPIKRGVTFSLILKFEI